MQALGPSPALIKHVVVRMEPKLFIFTLLFAITLNVECAKILAVFHFPSPSHHILGSALLKALAKRGHEVTMLSPFPLKTPVKNYEDIELTGMLDFKDDHKVMGIMQQQNLSLLTKMSNMMSTLNKINEHFLNHPSLKELLESKRTFDVVIQCYVGNNAFLAIPHHFGALSIAFNTVGSTPMVNQVTGNSAPPSYVPNMFPSLPSEMTFLQRATNTLISVLTDFYYHFSMVPEHQRLLQKYFPQAPTLEELISNISLFLLNAHYSIESPRPYVPSMIQVGGLQVEEPKELESDLKQFMDSAVDGVTFLSFGSNVKSSELPKDKLQAIVASLAKIPMKVLWKFETEDVQNLPSNVKIGKWLPQRDILAHPNTKLFITHGGLLSTTEAIYHGVPMVGVPFFGDQDSNVDDGVLKGYVFKIPFLELTEEKLTEAINEVLNNPKYRNNVRHTSAVFKDQPLKPLDNAVFWVEYVIRHKGAHHLKTTAIKLKWYQYYLLDVMGLIFVIILTLLGALYLILRLVLKFLKKLFGFGGNKSTSGKSPKPKKKTKQS